LTKVIKYGKYTTVSKLVVSIMVTKGERLLPFSC
jgi:hypothetical protein